MSSSKIQCAVTIDFEWWGRANLVSENVSFHSGFSRDLRALEKILEILNQLKIQATFFCVSDDTTADQAKVIVGQGHEIASHSVNHPLFSGLTDAQIHEQIYRSKADLEEKSGQPVVGFRTPSWSIKYDQQDRFLRVLSKVGYYYDSSFNKFPTKIYGDRRFSDQIFSHPSGIVEVPAPQVGFPKMPWVGGFYSRVTPLWLWKAFLRLHNRPVHFIYTHPWEFYAANQNASIKDVFSVDYQITHYGRTNYPEKFTKLLAWYGSKHQLGRMDQLVRSWIQDRQARSGD